MSEKTARKGYNAPARGQKHVRKRVKAMDDALDVEGLKINLGHLVGNLAAGGKVQAYEQIAGKMSALAGMNNGHSWSWRYVASVHSGSVGMSKKFACVLALLLEEVNPRKKQWFYFARYHSLAAVYDKVLRREMITEHMKDLGFKPVCFTRYMEIKRAACGRKNRRHAGQSTSRAGGKDEQAR